VGGYNQLLRENLDLRKKLETASQEEEKVTGENSRLQSEIRELEGKIAEFAGMVQTLKKKEITVEGRAQVQDMESKLQKTEEEKRRLLGELDALRKAGDERRKSAELPSAAGSAPVEKTAAVQRGSDLYRRLEQENLDLREKLTRLDAERQATVQAHAKIAADEATARTAVQQMTETEKQLRQALETARIQASEHKAKNEALLQQIPVLEKNLAVASKDAEQKGQALTAKEQQFEVMQDELRRREQRLIKAEKMAAILEQAREQVREMSEREKRDLHYNMGSIYAKEGRFKEAEAEYLKALKMDPSDADVHYNLGILYDEELKDKRRAAMHYRRYLQLSPHSPDADSVKGWLMAIDAR
jgi:tetratricopeptide (TPR) repeat protein